MWIIFSSFLSSFTSATFSKDIFFKHFPLQLLMTSKLLVNRKMAICSGWFKLHLNYFLNCLCVLSTMTVPLQKPLLLYFLLSGDGDIKATDTIRTILANVFSLHSQICQRWIWIWSFSFFPLLFLLLYVSKTWRLCYLLPWRPWMSYTNEPCSLKIKDNNINLLEFLNEKTVSKIIRTWLLKHIKNFLNI